MIKDKAIVIEEYSPGWPLAFAQLEEVYRSHLGSYVVGIEHVGSTSVEGLPAKPILDIDLIVEDSHLLPPVITALEEIGYQHVGDLGIPGREAFRRLNTPHNGSPNAWPEHNLYVCLAGSTSLKNHLAFRNYLRSHPGKARAYGELKKRLAAEHPHDIDAYVEGKTAFITGVLKEMGFDAAALDDITRQNKNVK
ncbi:MAG: GrpB family protein [Chitinophagaceae bacterium]|nr:GrpB family protein [Chitinophagaceae bacterium]